MNDDYPKNILYWICAIIILWVVLGLLAKYWIVPMIKADATQAITAKLSVLKDALQNV